MADGNHHPEDGGILLLLLEEDTAHGHAWHSQEEMKSWRDQECAYKAWERVLQLGETNSGREGRHFKPLQNLRKAGNIWLTSTSVCLPPALKEKDLDYVISEWPWGSPGPCAHYAFLTHVYRTDCIFSRPESQLENQLISVRGAA